MKRLKIHIQHPTGFLGRYLCAEACIRGGEVGHTPSAADVLFLNGWRYSDPARSLDESLAALGSFQGSAVIGVGSQSELWTEPGEWAAYATAKRRLAEAVLGSAVPRRHWVRLSALAGRGMTRGRLVTQAVNARRIGSALRLEGSGEELVSICDVRLVAKNLLDIPGKGVHVRNGWGERKSVKKYLQSWGVDFVPGMTPMRDTPPAFDDRDWNGWLDVEFTPRGFDELVHNYSADYEIV